MSTAQTHLHKVELLPKDYKTDTKPFWCPGCGDHGVLTSVYRALTELGVDPNYLVNISGIGCSSRLPYFVRSFKMHTLHGRAGPVATGVQLARPDLAILRAIGPIGQAPVHVAFVGRSAGARVLLWIENPFGFAGRGINRGHQAVQAAGVERAVDVERRVFRAPVGRADAERGVERIAHPGHLQFGHVGPIDLIQRRVLGAAGVPGIVAPLAAAGSLLGRKGMDTGHGKQQSKTREGGRRSGHGEYSLDSGARWA